nr:hypothetical protein [uncultured Neisseria sp.]
MAATFENAKDYVTAVNFYHQSTKVGESSSALVLSRAFAANDAKGKYKFWGMVEDEERSRCYDAIRDFLWKTLT